MDWATLAMIIGRFGINTAEYIFNKWQTGAIPTREEWDELRALANQTPRSQVLDAAARLGLSETDERVKALLALIPVPR